MYIQISEIESIVRQNDRSLSNVVTILNKESIATKTKTSVTTTTPSNLMEPASSTIQIEMPKLDM